eukprot:TRINITY_DN2594_c0_g1_i1.p1 TRINITY_DN2594_c0_g1~~TRINITY_DN2594_c0_g1_i1.p1  ORF type:complete len:277 (-),score=54.98 TRINITY_DN2594_c0_g1_i1:150-956(-)
MNPTELLASEFVISDFEELPKELVVMVIYFLDLVDVCTLRKTCTFFRTCIDFEEESIYRRLLFRRYGQSEVWKTEDGLWKDRFIDLYLFRFSTQHCTPTVKLADGRREATKTSDQAYGVVVGDARLAAGRHFWEVQVMQLWRSQCVCIGIVNDPVQAVAMESNQHGMFGHFEHGWGLFQDGDRCHDGAWIQPRAPPFRKNDRIGLQLEFGECGLATLKFYHNDMYCGDACTFDGIRGPVWPAVSMMNPGDTVRIRSLPGRPQRAGCQL